MRALAKIGLPLVGLILGPPAAGSTRIANEGGLNRVSSFGTPTLRMRNQKSSRKLNAADRKHKSIHGKSSGGNESGLRDSKKNLASDLFNSRQRDIKKIAAHHRSLGINEEGLAAASTDIPIGRKVTIDRLSNFLSIDEKLDKKQIKKEIEKVMESSSDEVTTEKSWLDDAGEIPLKVRSLYDSLYKRQ